MVKFELNFGSDPPGWLRAAKLVVRYDSDSLNHHMTPYVTFYEVKPGSSASAYMYIMISDCPGGERMNQISYYMTPSPHFVNFD